MNKGIAHILMAEMVAIPYLQKFGGLVRVQEQKDITADEFTGLDKRVYKKYPVCGDYCITKSEDCGVPDEIDFVPNASYFGISYFEDMGIEPMGREGRYQKYKSKLRLVVWLNTKMIVTSPGYEALPGHSIATAVLTDIESKFAAIEGKARGYYERLKVRQSSIPANNVNIFSSYSYREEDMQYLMPPYEFFAVDYHVEYRISQNCIDDITVSVSDIGCGVINPSPSPAQYPALDSLLPYTVNLTIGVHTNTGEVIIPDPDYLDLTNVVVLGAIVLGGINYQEVPLNEDGTGWDFKNHAGNVEQGVITVVVRKKIA